MIIREVTELKLLNARVLDSGIRSGKAATVFSSIHKLWKIYIASVSTYKERIT